MKRPYNIVQGSLRKHVILEDPETGTRTPTVFRIVPAMEGVSYP